MIRYELARPMHGQTAAQKCAAIIGNELCAPDLAVSLQRYHDVKNRNKPN